MESRERGGLLGGLVLHLYSRFSGYRNTIPCLFQCFFLSSYPQRRRLLLLPPKQEAAATVSVSVSLSASLSGSLTACCCRALKGWALSLCLFLLRLSLLVTPPCVPTPHLSVSQEKLRSPAALQPCREEPSRAERSCCSCPAAEPGRRAGGEEHAAAEPHTKYAMWGNHLIACKPAILACIYSLTIYYKAPCCSSCCLLLRDGGTHVTFLTSASRLIEDTPAGWRGLGRGLEYISSKALQHYISYDTVHTAQLDEGSCTAKWDDR